MSLLFQSIQSSDKEKQEDGTTAMLSPPLSPYPKLASVATSTTPEVPRQEVEEQKILSQPATQATSPENSPAMSNATLVKNVSNHDPVHHLQQLSQPAHQRPPSGPPARAAPPPAPQSLDHHKTSFNNNYTVSSTSNLQPASASLINSRYKIQKHNPKSAMVSSAWSCLKNDPVGYYQREMNYLGLYPKNGPTWSNYVHLSPQGKEKVPSHSSRPATRTNRIKRRRFNLPDDPSPEAMMTTRSSTRGGTTSASTAATAAAPSTPKTNASRNSTPKPRAPRPSPAGSGSKVHDTEYEQLTDYCPSVDTLPAGGKSLKAEWKGAPMDLSGDPDAHLLHPAELHLASVLRLPCQLYLDSKKRLFAEKVHRMKNGLPFRRTDSQKACRIDVNKASRLFSAFERVGWLDDDLFEKYL